MPIDFTVKPVDEKPKKNTHLGRKGSKYQYILDEFLKSDHRLVRVDTAVEANYLVMVLKKIIKKKGLYDNIQVSVRNRIAYIEKYNTR